MKIDLKWAIPFVAPFVLFTWFSLLFVFAGLGWPEGQNAVKTMATSIMLGSISGTIAAVWMQYENIRWEVRLWGRDEGE